MRKLWSRFHLRLFMGATGLGVLLGAGTLGDALPSPDSPEEMSVRLSTVVVKVPPEERARRELIRAATEHYGIGRELAARIHDIAVEEGVDPALAFGLVRVESHFVPDAVGPAGARGLTQVMPATASGLDPDIEPSELFEPETNLRLGMRYLRWLMEHYDGDHRLALTAYNRGPGTVARARAAGESPYNGYASRVLEHRIPRFLSGGPSPR